MATLLAVLIASLLATGCDGGLFGTGDGDISADIAATDASEPDDIATNPEDGTEDVAAESGGESGEASTPSNTPDSDTSGLILSFSNTLPSGLDSLTAPLPALKVINLAADAVNAAALNTPSTDASVNAQPGTSSELLPINIGETDIVLVTVDDGAQFAVVSPLNSAENSLTSIIVSGSVNNPDSGATANESSNLSVLALETRAAVSASGMAEVRLVRTAAVSSDEADADSTSSLPTQYLLTPDDNNASGVELVFTTLADGSAQINSYQLIAPGDYTLSNNGDTSFSQQITLEANEVYTLIVTPETQNSVFVEVDSRLPVLD